MLGLQEFDEINILQANKMMLNQSVRLFFFYFCRGIILSVDWFYLFV